MPSSDYLKGKILDHVFRATNYAPAGALYIALYTTAPTGAGGGVEVAGNGYARQAVTFDPPAGGEIVNAAVDFGAPVGGDWGTVVAAGVFDAATGGNLLVYENLLVQQVTAEGNPFTFPAGNVTIRGV